jgi:type IV pilus assembly protein PilM
MVLPFQSPQAKRRSQILAIDMGTRTTKAVHVQRKGSGYDLLQYVVQDAPVYEKGFSPELFSEHLKNISQALGAKIKQTLLIPGVNDALLRHAELPMVPVADMRLMLKYNSKNYLQQDFPDYVFDCFVLPPRPGPASTEPLKNQKCRVLVGGAKKQFLDHLQEATKSAGLVAEEITPSLIGTANAFEMAQPEVFAKEVVALVDIGFKHSSITILFHGELSLSRVVGIGGDKLTSGLSDAMGISYSEAEQVKVSMADEAQSMMMALLTPLGRELRASIDFFEKQEDKTVGQVFISGGSACAPFIIETLQGELMVPCKSWNPIAFLNLALPPQQMGAVEQLAPQLAVAAGGAMAAL